MKVRKWKQKKRPAGIEQVSFFDMHSSAAVMLAQNSQRFQILTRSLHNRRKMVHKRRSHFSKVS